MSKLPSPHAPPPSFEWSPFLSPGLARASFGACAPSAAIEVTALLLFSRLLPSKSHSSLLKSLVLSGRGDAYGDADFSRSPKCLSMPLALLSAL